MTLETAQQESPAKTEQVEVAPKTEPEAEETAVAPKSARAPKTRTSRRVIVETMIVAIVTSVVVTVAQKLMFGESSIPISVAMTVVMEVIYFKFLSKRI